MTQISTVPLNCTILHNCAGLSCVVELLCSDYWSIFGNKMYTHCSTFQIHLFFYYSIFFENTIINNFNKINNNKDNRKLGESGFWNNRFTINATFIILEITEKASVLQICLLFLTKAQV